MSVSETPVHDEFYENLLGDFLDESAQLLDRLNENLLKLDEWVQTYEGSTPPPCDADLLNEMFRAAHSLKGLSAMLGLQEINQLTHKVENVFDAARKNQLPITRDVVNLIFEGVDRLGALVEALKDPSSEPVEYEGVLGKIHHLLKATGAERGPSTQADAERALAAVEQAVQALDQSMGGSSGSEGAASEDQPGTLSAVESASDAVGVHTGEVEGQKEVSISTTPLPSLTSPASASIPSQTPDPLEGIQDEPNLPAKYVGIFIDEADQTLDELTEILLAVDNSASKETVEKLLVLSHKLKGSAASIGLHRAAKLAHLMEDVLQELMAQQVVLQPALTDVFLRGTDTLRQFVQDLRQGQPTTESFGPVARELLAALQTVRSGGVGEGTGVASGGASDTHRNSGASGPEGISSLQKAGPSEASAPHAVSAAWKSQVTSKIPEGSQAILGEVYFEDHLPLVGLKGRLIYEKVARMGEVCQFDPPPDTLDDLEVLEKVSFGVLTDQSISVAEIQLQIAGVRRIVLETWPTRSETPSRDSSSVRPAESKESTSRVATVTASASAIRPKTPEASPTSRTSVEAANAEAAAKPTETLRVDIERLDQLMNLAGQLVINKARFSQISDTLKNVLSSRNPLQLLERVSAALEAMGQANGAEKLDSHTLVEGFRSTARRLQHELEDLRKDLQLLPRARQAVYELQEAVHQLDRVTDGLQRTVMQTRMVPIGPLFTRFKRVVRDITRMSGKMAQLVILGEKTELDKRMIDELGDPLIHLVRNAVDHGIEPPDVRESLGKPRQGTVTLEAFHRGNSIVIRVSDDGRGLDADKILRKAIEKGLVSPADAEKMTRQQIYQLIWQPGLSTAEKVTEVSGRGMGMDIVLSKISDLNGTVDIDSTPGVGTTMTIKLPLTLAILPSLMIEIDGDTFALPIETVAEIVHLRRSDMYTIQGQWAARIRNAVISVVHLRDLFTWNQPSPTCTENSEQRTLVILGETGRQIGLAVDRVLGEEDVVIKSISENYHNVPGLAGASILGDGRVALILDVTALVEMASGRHNLSAC